MSNFAKIIPMIVQRVHVTENEKGIKQSYASCNKHPDVCAIVINSEANYSWHVECAAVNRRDS